MRIQPLDPAEVECLIQLLCKPAEPHYLTSYGGL